MKFADHKLQAALRRQSDTVVLIDVDGHERRGIGPQYAADFIAGRAFVGYGKNGVVESVKAVDAPRRRPFVIVHGRMAFPLESLLKVPTPAEREIYTRQIDREWFGSRPWQDSYSEKASRVRWAALRRAQMTAEK